MELDDGHGGDGERFGRCGCARSSRSFSCICALPTVKATCITFQTDRVGPWRVRRGLGDRESMIAIISLTPMPWCAGRRHVEAGDDKPVDLQAGA